MHDVLVEALHAAMVVVGDNFRFGHRAAGDVTLLEGLGRSFGFTVEDAPLVSDGRAGVLLHVHPQPVSTPGTCGPRRPRSAGRTAWPASSSAVINAAASWAFPPPT